MAHKYIFFDLDGTLTDSKEGIVNSICYALERYNIKVEERSMLYSFLGPPLKDSFMKYFGFEPEKANEAVDVYREYFSGKGLFENKVYEGIKELLEELKAGGRTLAVATSKPELFTNRILEHFNLREYFDFVAGATMDENRTKKGDIIKYALESMNIHDKSQVIMVGDRHHDIDGAYENSLESIGVLYGYGSLQELENAKATYIVETVSQLKELLTKL